MIGSFLHPRVYLDSAAAAPVIPAAQRAYMRALHIYGNPSSPHTEGRAAGVLLEGARAAIAKLAEVKPDAVIATGGATEANALGILGHVRALIESGSDPHTLHVLYDSSAHRSLTKSVERLAREGVSIEPLHYKDGEIDLSALASQIQPGTCLVAVSAVCGETGRITAVRDIRRVLDKVAPTHVALHVDASQLPLVGAYELTRLGADMLVLDAQKVGGVRGVGVLIAPRRVLLLPLYEGGGQERELRPGTPSPAHVAAFATALTRAHECRAVFTRHARMLRSIVVEGVSSLPQVFIHEATEQAPHILGLSLVGRDTDYLVALLDKDGFAVSTKSACEQNGEGSRSVLLRTGDPAQAASTLRISFHAGTSVREVRAFTRALIANVKFLDTAGIL